jgi:sigma-B regulation protein RsbU (phosphoserine phosphatase)
MSGPAEEGDQRVDLGIVAQDPQAESLLRQAAELHGSPIYLADPEGKVVASFAPASWGGTAPDRLPTDPAEAAERGTVLRKILVYDGHCGWVGAAGLAGAASAASRFAADLVAAFATKQYEAESLSKSLLDTYEEVNLFYGITSSLHRVGNSEGICSTILRRACEIVRSARASILLADPHTGLLRIVASHGMSPEHAAAVRVKPGEGVVGRVMKTGQAVLVDDAEPGAAGAGAGDHQYASRSFISVPIRVFDPEELSGSKPAEGRRGAIGVLNLTDKAGGTRFTSGDMKLLSALASQAAVLLDNTRLAGMEKEMGLARTIQASLLPQSSPKVPGVELAGICLPCRNVGGDYYDMIALPGGKAAILIADVSGHNVGAALMMAVSRAALRAEIDRSVEPEEILSRANRLLDADLARSELFVSVFLGIYDPASGTLAYASAGHNPAMLRRAAGGAVESLDAEGILLGVAGDFVFERRTVKLAEGDVVLLYTDGLTEARDAGGSMFEEERLQAAFVEASDLPTAQIPRALIAAVDGFTAASPADDRTAAVLRAVRMPSGSPGDGKSGR